VKEKIMLKFLKNLFGSKPASERHPLDAVTTPNVSAPYKVPEPAATTPIPYIPETPLVKLGPEPTVDKVEAAPVVESTPKPKAVAKPKAPAKPKAAKPAAIKAPAKPKAPAKKPKISIAK
jgi:hypothetical protein